MHRAPWQNPTIIATLLVIFCLGVAAGAAIMKVARPAERHATAPQWPDGGKQIAMEQWTRELNLTPEQAKEMETVLDDFMMYMQTLQAQMDDTRATGKQRIMKILHEDQRQKFEKMLGDIMSSKQIR